MEGLVLIRKGNRPITLHSCRWRFNSVTMACQGPQIHNDLQNAILIHSYHASCSSPNYVLFQHHGNVNFSNRKFNKILVAFVSNTQQNADAIPSDAINKSMKTHQCIHIEPKYFTNHHHLFSYWVLLCASSSNNKRIVDIHPSKFYMWIWFWHRRKFFPSMSIIKHINITIHNLHKQIVVFKRRAITKINK